MAERIQLLIVEDSQPDAELIAHELTDAGFDLIWQRVETEQAYLAAMRPDLDLIISDYELPCFSGLRALHLLRQRAPEIPFIVISGVIGEETAVAAIKQGASDYLLKDRLGRLGPAVRQAIDQARLKIACQVAEEAATQGEYRFRMLFETAHDPVYILENGVFVDCNPQGEYIYGRTRAQILGHTPDEFAPPTQPDGRNSREKAAEIIAKCQAGHPQVFEWMSLHLDGTPVYTDVSLNRMVLGLKVYMLAIARDTTARKLAETKIAEQAAYLDKTRDAIIVRDLAGRIIFWNMGAERLYGWTKDEVAGRNVLEILLTPAARFEEINQRTTSQGEWSGELCHVTRNGSEITVEVRCSLIRDEAGRPKSIISINTDVTEKKKIEAQFMRAQRMESIGALAGGVAHDLNNILTPITMSIGLLKATAPSTHEKEILAAISTSAQRGSDIVRQLLSFARGVEGHRMEVPAGRLVQDISDILRDTLPRNIRLKFNLPADIWAVFGDPTQIDQVLLNLCLNARDAMPNGGRLTVSMENCVLDEPYAASHVEARPGRYVKISVADSGTGMRREVLDRIFEPFFTTKELNKGTGLGLSTVMAIVKSHEGIINVCSEPGKGSTFTIFLPTAVRESATRTVKAETGTIPRGRGETVLIIDDEASILAVTSHTLAAFGYRVLTAADGAEALMIYQQEESHISAVLTDMAMPVMDGTATIAALRRINPDLKIIASSGLAPSASGAPFSDATHHFLAKPYTAEDLLRTIRLTLDEPNSLASPRPG